MDERLPRGWGKQRGPHLRRIGERACQRHYLAEAGAQLAGAAVLGSTGVLGLFSRRADANTGHFVPCDRETSDFINNFTCNGDECGPAHCETMDCHCVLTRQGGVRCANFAGEHCPATDQCDVNGDCPDNQLCVRVGGCCGHPRRNLCVRRCPEHCPSRGTGGSDFLPPH